MNYLKKILEYKQIEITEKKSRVPAGILEKAIVAEKNRNSLTDTLSDPVHRKIIAEFKRKSPSKGMINDKADPAVICKGYFDEGAAGVSVLTDYKFFGGTVEDLAEVRMATPSPLLRKDFILDEYQIIESAAMGAGVILLIAAIHDKRRLKELARFAKKTGLQVLFEVHRPDELSLLNEFVDIVGVNNRNLQNFRTDVATSFEMANSIPGDFIKISESGIDSPATLMKLHDIGYQGFLIGERFMQSEDPVNAFRNFVRQI